MLNLYLIVQTMKKFNISIKMHIYMKQYTLLLLVALCLLSCSEDKIETYHGGQYLYFSELMGSSDEAVEISFYNYPLDNELTVEIALGLVGDPVKVATPYKVSVVSEKTTALSENYKLPETPEFKPDVAEDKLKLKLIKTDKLTKDVTLMLKIEPNEYFTGTIAQYDTIKVIFNNIESKPLWWNKDVIKTYLGTYSREKYVALMQYGGDEATKFSELNSGQKRQCALRLKEAIEKYALKEANGDPMTVPIY